MKRRGLIIDTNLLVLLVVGRTSIELVDVHKRVADYSARDFSLLNRLVGRARPLAATQPVMAETSNLLRNVTEPIRGRVMMSFQRILAELEERHVPAPEIARSLHFLTLGFSDAGLVAAAKDNDSILTADLGLHRTARKAGRASILFDDLRAATSRS